MTSLSSSTVTLSSPVSRVPPEVLLMIMEHLWNREANQLVSLALCSMVCSQWRSIAQPMLFTEVFLYFQNTTQNFITILQNNHSLGQAMKTLSFTAFPISLDPKRGPASNWLKDVTFHCPRLYELRLKLPFSMNKETCKSLLHPHTFTSLRSFRLSFGGYINLHRDLLGWLDILRLLSQFSSLSHLYLENTRNLELSPQYPSDLSPPSFSLYEFGWSNFRDTSRTSNLDGFKYIVGWLFGESSSCLRILDLNEVRPRVEGEMLISMASNHGRNLSSLRTTLQKQDIVSMGLNLSEACPNLQELILHRVDFPSPELWRTLPVDRLEHIAFSDCDYGVGSRDKELISQAIDWTMSLPSIRLVTIQSNSYTEDFLNIVCWRERCTNDVRLEIIHPIGDFESREDRVPTTLFPRRRTFANLARMSALLHLRDD